MHQLGFVQSCASWEVDPVHFFFKNIPGFFSLNGLKSDRVSCSVFPYEDKDDLKIVVSGKPYSVVEGKRIAIPEWAIRICLEETFVEALKIGDPSLFLGRLWYYTGFYLRLWELRTKKVAVKDLVPAKLLYELEDTRDLIDQFLDLHYVRKLGDEELFYYFDAAIVGFYLTGLMESDDCVINMIHESEIAEIIFDARASNWHKLTARH
jgi:hypothetical protein